MRDTQGRGVMRLGDRTSHGGEGSSASGTLQALGKAVARDGDMTFCPRCEGKFPITTVPAPSPSPAWRAMHQRRPPAPRRHGQDRK